MNLDNYLLEVNKPARYLGGEWNCRIKDFEKAYIRFALCFPDTYEVGMSNLGIRIIYGLLNSIEDVVCERVFLIDRDLEEIIRRDKKTIFSLESKKRLIDFDIIGFSLNYELLYPDVLNILELAGIPAFSGERKEGYPLIIAGGMCSLNPEPIAEFIDLFVIGEAEETILKIIDIYRKLKKKNSDRRPPKNTCLHQFKYIEGVYIPSFYKVSYDRKNRLIDFKPIEKDTPSVIKKSYVKELDKSFYPIDWIVPYVEIVHDRLILELMRGCPHNCRFCQARVYYFPYRCKSIAKLLDLAEEMIKNTGYEEISLAGLSISDYPKINSLIEGLIEKFKEKRIGISFSSLREKDTLKELLPIFNRMRKTGLTFAPETASERLHKIINKNFNLNSFFSLIEEIYRRGYRHIKLYFMLGIPTEEKIDLERILNLSRYVSEIKSRIDKRPAWLSLSLSTFIPKPHTPFQWLGMERLEKIKEKQEYILSKLKIKDRLYLKFHNPYMSLIECLLSRGDRRLAPVIYDVFKMKRSGRGFSLGVWQEACKKNNIDLESYTYQFYHKDEFLAWDFIFTGISKESLWKELEEALGINKC
ncbi:MAG: TIGR03960 family B12-binding radical SAM protein [Candidatus Omnitrophica bacterium]|nr:TIGR03960 family B12-binding radical SAM protein [Candidatus Omnitrophota bacterium]